MEMLKIQEGARGTDAGERRDTAFAAQRAETNAPDAGRNSSPSADYVAQPCRSCKFFKMARPA